MLGQCPEWYTDVQIGQFYLDTYCLIHLDDNLDKVRLYALMARKLFRLSLKRSMVDNPDSPENHEALLPGHLFQSFTREIIESAMDLIKGTGFKIFCFLAENRFEVHFYNLRERPNGERLSRATGKR